ncbi:MULTISPECIES: trypsin-like serine peptidase [Caballeronia]|uniref:trypsin-like serine peptidase n=1 Tax=Caballeronia TaxID=1827195 RepID=UPI001EF70AA1|nr:MULTISPECIES: trypsin-like serine protease [Caballeronia]MCG7401795.1 trypsin-like serine protease [Caballeronia zhejiangensis]
MKRSKRVACVEATALVALSMASAGVAHADDEAVVNPNPAASREAPADLSNLKPVVNVLAPPDTSAIMPETSAGPYTPGVNTPAGIVSNAQTRAYGTFGIPYSTGRVQDGNQSAAGSTSANYLSTTYPYRAIGKLTFSAGYCTASLIRRSVIVTAAHCIQSFGSGSSLFSNWQFRPGHYGASGATSAQIAPYGTWNWAALVRPSAWANGTDTGSGSARNNDIAVIAIAKNASNQFIGDITGYLSYGWNNYSFISSPKTGNLQTAAVTTFGYPTLLDGGAIMQRTDGPAYTTTVSGASQLWQGSNLTSGASGGPWIVNFRPRDAVLSGGAVIGNASNLSIIGVTSWGSSDPNAIKDNYASQFRQNTQYPNATYGNYGAGNIASLLNTLCSTAAPGGGTYASQGYCN